MLSRSRGVAQRGIRSLVAGLAPASAALASAAPLLATPARSFGIRHDPYANVESVEADQERIADFLAANGLSDHAGKFKSWEHMLMSESKTLKHHLQIPIKDRKKLRRASYVWRMTQYYTTGTPYVPQGPDGKPQPPRRHALERLAESSEEELATLVPMENIVGVISTSRHYPGAHPREMYVEIPNKANIPPASREELAAFDVSAEDSLSQQREVFMRGVLSDDSGSEDANKAIAALTGQKAAGESEDAEGDAASEMKRALEKADADAAAAAASAVAAEDAVASDLDDYSSSNAGMSVSEAIKIATVGRSGVRV